MFCPIKSIELIPNIINEISMILESAYLRPEENVKYTLNNFLMILTIIFIF